MKSNIKSNKTLGILNFFGLSIFYTKYWWFLFFIIPPFTIIFSILFYAHYVMVLIHLFSKGNIKVLGKDQVWSNKDQAITWGWINIVHFLIQIFIYNIKNRKKVS